ncbi:hypothetical protein ASZ78_011929 [Callipepla squamata]|uniref:Claspin n=1 Tax=Callipepla squamata TaxID=9009 RepID=A0A226NFK7_CALSU|nr:hypothetical protein ASZ78_011929 [Callipepla squamata]
MAAALPELRPEELDVAVLKAHGSGADSGQGSAEPPSSGQPPTGTAIPQDGDSEEEIFVSRKAKGKKVLQDSESEDDGGDSPVQNDALGGDTENGEEKEKVTAQRNKKSQIRQGLLDSDDSDTGDCLQSENLDPSRKSVLSENELEEERPLKSGKKSRKDKHNLGDKAAEKAAGKPRRKERERRAESIKQLIKEKKPSSEGTQVDGGQRYPFNDSGCLLDDKDLFDNGLEEENDSFPGDEESIESIRAAVKEKVKKHKNKERFAEDEGYKHVFGGDDDEESVLKEPKRKERKAARLSKEAIKQLHSETQRLIRESSVSLPYHMPEAKSVHEFFKRRSRPVCEGNAMALLKSTKYQFTLNEEAVGTKTSSTDCKDGPIEGGQSAANEPEANVGRDVDTPAVKPLPSVGEDLTEDCAEKSGKSSDDSRSVTTVTAASETEEQQSVLSTDCSEQKEGDIPLPVGGNALEQRGETAAPGLETNQQVGPGLAAQPEKVRKSKLDKLRELGIDLSIKPRICSGNESFINLDESDLNKELEALKARFLKHTLQTSKSKAERTINVNIIRKETTSEGKEELKADVVPVVLAAESLDEAVHAKPGEKLQVLKAKLQEAMKLRRTEERQKRQALFKLDNEELLEEEEEEEEEEMTDESEEEEEGDHEAVESLLDEAEEDNEELEEKQVEDCDKESDRESIDGEKVEQSVDCASVPKLPSTESTLMLFKDSSSKMGYSLPDEKHEIEEAADKGPTKLASMDENAMDANMDELLDLCSGQFSSQAEHVPSTSTNKKQNMEELLNLCSGKFVTQTDSPTWASSVSSKAEKDSDIEDPMAEALALCSGSFPTDREEEEEEEHEELGDFQLVTDDNAFDSEEDEKSGDGDEEAAEIKNGSLLNRPKDILQKLAAMSDLNPNAPRNSRNFVFHTLSPDKNEEAKEKSKHQVKKRGPSAAVTSLAKRPRVDSTEQTSQSRSIFQYLES